MLMTASGEADTSSSPVRMQLESNALLLRHAGCSLPISLTCPQFILDGQAVGIGIVPTHIEGDVASGRPVEVRFDPIPLGSSSRLEVRLFLQWSAGQSVLRKWASFRLTGSESPILLKKVVLEGSDTDATQLRPGDGLQSHPVFPQGFFAGIEYPVAQCRLDGGRLFLAHQPGLRVQPGSWYRTRDAVYGVADKGREVRAFERYISANRPGPKGFHINYNSWWTSPVPYSEADILKLTETFAEKLWKPYGVSFDTFCIDMGWSDPNSLWDINTRLFPDRFKRIQEAARRMNSHLGLWVSPSNCYSPRSMDNEWAKDQGYETFAIESGGGRSARLACLGGRRYRKALKDRLVEIATLYDVRHFKFDGYRFDCPESGHGHEPGVLSAEAVADGIIDVFRAIRKAAPDTWIETTCFGWNPSPWWLLYVNSVIGTFGDDYPSGRVPAPVYRESGTTARDFFNLQGAANLPIPIGAQEVLGIVHQTQEPFLNDAVAVVMRGHMFLPAYINPAHMSDSRWRSLAGVLKWAREHAPALHETEPLLPVSWQNGKCPRFASGAPMPREPYGYAHWGGNRGLVMLRNPWIAPQSYVLKLDTGLGASAGAARLTAVSLYPEPRVYGRGLKPGGTLTVPLAPYETLVLSIGPREFTKGIPGVEDALRSQLQVMDAKHEVGGVGDMTSAVCVKFEGKVRVKSQRAELLILLEGDDAPKAPLSTIRINGKESEATASSSKAGWKATGMAAPEHWLFLGVPLSGGEHTVSAEILFDNGAPTVSAWVWATRPGRTDTSVYPNSLPEPELVSLDAVPLMEVVDTSAVPCEIERTGQPTE